MRFLWTPNRKDAKAYSLDQIKRLQNVFRDITYDKILIPSPRTAPKYHLTFSYPHGHGDQPNYIRAPFPYPPNAPYSHLPEYAFRFQFTENKDIATTHTKINTEFILGVLNDLFYDIHPQIKGETPTGKKEYYCVTITHRAKTLNKPFFLITDFKQYDEDKW